MAEIEAVSQRFRRFRPVLAQLFPQAGWDGQICSPLIPYSAGDLAPGRLWIKADHQLPMTGSVKARGGVHELLCAIEDFALSERLISGQDLSSLLETDARIRLSKLHVTVASTGNLGFSIGLVARAFGVAVDVHMSSDAKTWKKDRLRALGARVIEHSSDYEGAVAAARDEAARTSAYFIDDERSRRLFAGYATAGRELAEQLSAAGVNISAEHPLVVYLPCGVGGAPGGITAGLMHEFGDHMTVVFVEPNASACMMLALAEGRRMPVYEAGLNNKTIADGLAVPTASGLALQLVGPRIDAVVALPDAMLIQGMRQAWTQGLRLEPSAAAALMAIAPFITSHPDPGLMERAVHVAWTTGGSLLPDEEFFGLMGAQ